MTSHPAATRKLWEPVSPQATQIWKSKEILEKAKGIKLPDYNVVYEWSVANRIEFWEFCWNYSPIIHEGNYQSLTDPHARIDSIPDWFPGVCLNYAENIFFTAGHPGHAPSTVTTIALTEVREGDAESNVNLIWRGLRQKAGRLSQPRKSGVLLSLCRD
ncbi:hypothetical protein N7468_007516 [Penicillium chermesinum]|uniref:Uncharacterized protein n=1 Tax=Penicillium chermesinum TaxID=63820 RepID=A0A9W9NU70_9EURO|nr:uncharacterized protein N7468_007516 [Penicillium chermesinum]KAJ5226291.1 hypothetical protein N7468_007516 [Penicillium chermesinum]